MLKDELQKIADELLEKVSPRVSIAHDEGSFNDVNITQYNSNYHCFLTLGPIDRGPRTDHGGGETGDDWMDSNQLEELEKEYFKKNDRKYNEIVEFVKESILPYNITKFNSCLDYGEKGHVTVGISFIIDGKMIEYNGNKYWLDYTGTYDSENIMISTPDIERYFGSEAAIMDFLKTYSYESNNDPF